MKEMKKLLDVAERLLGPNGCPWDKEQTIFTLQPYLLEETHELIEAIDAKDHSKIKEELGDVLYALIFVAMLAEKEGGFKFFEAVDAVAEKLIRRHPHVFGELKVDSTDDVLKNWEETKKKEGKKNPLDGIPPTLPSLARAQKVISKSRRSHHLQKMEPTLKSEEELGEKLWLLAREADAAGFDAESALRRICLKREESFKNKNTGDDPVA